MRFKDRVAIVTGGAGGVGRAIAAGLAGEGALVALIDLDRARLESEVASVQAQSPQGRVLAFPCDITSSSEVGRMADQVWATWGRIDILVNNAGIIRRGDIGTVSEEDWDRVLSVNLKGPFLCAKAVAPIMKRQGGGKIVNISSIAGKMGDIASAPGYGPSKAGLDALTKTLARQLASWGVNVNAVSPHAIETEMSAQWSDQKRKEIIAGIPLGRLGTPREVAAAVLFLASEEASFITGEILDVNGGALMD